MSGQEPRAHSRRGQGGGEVVPPAEFTSYYGRPVVKPAPWGPDIPAYLFTGGLAAGSSLLAAGADLTGRHGLRRVTRLVALGGISASLVALIHDLGRPARFLNMLRTFKVTSPMSVGTWILTLYGPPAGLAAAAEVAQALPLPDQWVRRAQLAGRAAGLAAGLTAPPVAAYTAVLLADTATPSWHDAYRQLPLVFVASAAAAAGGAGMTGAPVAEASPARRLGAGGAVIELVAERVMERAMGLTAEPLRTGRAGRLMRAARALSVIGAAGSLLARRSRAAAVVSGVALTTASALTRFGIVEAGKASARDPRYTVVPQRERLASGGRAGG